MPKSLSFPVRQQDISRFLGREVHSPIYVSSLERMGVDSSRFLVDFSSFFKELPWDPYDARRLRVEFLLGAFPGEKDEIMAFFRPYYLGEADFSAFSAWVARLDAERKAALEEIQPWRRRSVSQFLVQSTPDGIDIQREKVQQFVQEVEGEDFRSLPRVFEESPAHHIGHPLFREWMRKVLQITQEARPDAKAIRLVAHFMSVKASPGHPGDNSPEGAHEDGADYIVSALVVNRHNVAGGESQIIEKRPDGSKEVIFRHILKEGEFIFQADSKDEITHGTDLWHHVTPFALADETKGEGWRDIIGFDINVLGL